MNKIDSLIRYCTLLWILSAVSTCFAVESISEVQMSRMRELVNSSFSQGSVIQNVPSDCLKPEQFELGMAVLEVYLKSIEFASSRDTPARIDPYVTTQGIYAVPVIVDNKACYIELFRFPDGSVEYVGSTFSPVYAEQLVNVAKGSMKKESFVERIVYLKSDMFKKIVVIYKDGTEEFHSVSPGTDRTPNSATELRDFLRQVYKNQMLIPTK